MLIDTHAHIHFDDFRVDLAELFRNARASQLSAIITVGTNANDSLKCLDFVFSSEAIGLADGIELFATVGLHPHEAKLGALELEKINQLANTKKYSSLLVAIGECGLDYYRNNSTKAEQLRALEFQLQLANDLDLPVVFHVREAWQDFFAVLKNHPKVRGVIHSFTGTSDEVGNALAYNLYFGLNGIMTFTKDQAQLEAARLVPADRLLLETDCPYLSPAPVRGKRNEPANIVFTAEFLSALRAEDYLDIAHQSSQNAKHLFSL